MSNPIVSIIVPIYNVERFLSGCLNSILAQTFQDFEAILVDDGSTDSSGEIAKEFAKKNKRFLFIHQENKGLSGARNTALQLARGKYIHFLDSDDYIHPDFLRIMVETIETENADMVVTKLSNTDKMYHKIDETLDLTQITKRTFLNPFDDFLNNKCLPSNVCVKLYTKKSIGDLIFKQGIYFEDILFTTLYMNQIQKAVYLDTVVYYHYENKDSIMNSSFNEKKVYSYLTVINDIYHFVKDERPDRLLNVQKGILNKRVKMMMNQAIRRQKDKDKGLKLFEMMAKEFRPLFHKGIITYEGLKLHQRVVLSLLIHGYYKIGYRIMRLLK